MEYKKCNIFINHEGMSIKVTGIKKWNTKNMYYDLRNENGYIGFVRCEGLKYESTLNEGGEIIRFYKTVRI